MANSKKAYKYGVFRQDLLTVNQWVTGSSPVRGATFQYYHHFWRPYGDPMQVTRGGIHVHIVLAPQLEKNWLLTCFLFKLETIPQQALRYSF